MITARTGSSGLGDHPAPQRQRAALWPLAFGLCGAPAAWLAQLNLSFLVGEYGCSQAPIAGSISAVTLAIDAVALLVGALALVAAVNAYRVTRTEAAGDASQAVSTGLGRTRFMALSGIISSAIFLVGIVLFAIVPLLASSCGS